MKNYLFLLLQVVFLFITSLSGKSMSKDTIECKVNLAGNFEYQFNAVSDSNELLFLCRKEIDKVEIAASVKKMFCYDEMTTREVICEETIDLFYDYELNDSVLLKQLFQIKLKDIYLMVESQSVKIESISVEAFSLASESRIFKKP